MQNEDKIVVGLDIGTTKICVLVGRKNEFGKLEILGMGKAVSEGVMRGIVSNIDKTVDAIKKALRQAEEQSGINIGIVNVGIAGQHIKSLMHSGHIMRGTSDNEITIDDVNRLTNDMYRLVTPPGTEIIHVMPQDYKVDYEDAIIDPVGMAGIRLEGNFHIITAQSNAINNINKCVMRAGLEIDNLILEPLASSMAVLSDEEKEAGVALIDIGGGTTDLAIFKDNIIRHAAVLPFGGNILTQDIKQGCAVMQNQAEQLKIKFGRAISGEASDNEIVSIPGLRDRAPKEISLKNLAHIIEARMEEIVELVYAEIVRSGYANNLAAGIVITGGGAQLQNLVQLVEYITGMDARIGYPNEHLGKSKIEAVKSPMYATSVGLVLAGYHSIDERLNRQAESAYNSTGQSAANNARAPQPQADSTGSGSSFFKNILDRTKGLLIDDFDDKASY